MNDDFPLTRRALLKSFTAAGVLTTLRGAPGGRPNRLGIVQYSLGRHLQIGRQRKQDDLSEPRQFLDECHRFGAGGIQVPLGVRPEAEIKGLRGRAEQYGMFLEGIINPPKDRGDLERFEREVRCAAEAGADVARTVIIPGRRYEQFSSLEEFREFELRGRKSLELAEPVLARNRFKLAVENHKDHRMDERVALHRAIGSEWIGACVDIGNNFALLEDPLESVRALAPYAMTVHVKDHQLYADADGFWMTDVALGEGFLDLATMVTVLRAAKPSIRFNLESITRDPIAIPVLQEKYWATFPAVPAVELARTLRAVRAHSTAAPLPKISTLPPEEQLAAERRLVLASIEYAAQRLDL